MGRLIMGGVGMGLGLALWPIVLPALAVVGVANVMKNMKPQEIAEPDKPAPQPMLADVKRQALAAVEIANREHQSRGLERF